MASPRGSPAMLFGEGIGTFADYAAASADQLAALPADTSFQEAAALPLAATTALLCLEEARLEPGSSVLINGASGGVGTFAVQAAKTRDLHVTVVVCTRNIALVRSLGADVVIDYTTTDFTCTGHSYDAVVDLVGNRLLQDLRPSVAMAVARFQPFEMTVPQSVPDTPTLAHVADLVVSGSLRPLIDRAFSAPEAASGQRYASTGTMPSTTFARKSRALAPPREALSGSIGRVASGVGSTRPTSRRVRQTCGSRAGRGSCGAAA